MQRQSGFTFIEVLVAMLILVLAVLAAANIANGSVRATREAKEISKATWLLQNVMTELETKLEAEGVERGCEKKKEGKFEAPNEGYTWLTGCYEIDLKLSQTASKIQAAIDGGEKDSNEPTQEDILKKMILDTASDYISKALRELHAEVYWVQGKMKRKVTLTTHMVRFDQPLTLGSIGGAGAGGGGGAPTPSNKGNP